MDDVIVRSRYPRRNIHSRKRRKNIRESTPLIEIIARQTVLCLLILIFIGLVKSVNTPAGKFLVDKTKWVTTNNLEFGSLYSALDGLLKKVGMKGFLDKPQSDTEEPLEEAMPASAEAYAPEDSGTDIESLNFEEAVQTEQKARPQDKSARGDTAGESNNVQVKSTPTPAPKTTGITFVAPVKGLVGEPFGERIHPIKKTTEFHKGIDIEANKGDSIKAVQAGEVIEAGKEATYGNYMKVKHSDGFISLYAHCSSLVAKKGQKVKQGEVIAKVGDTGLSIGAHLHLELWKDGKPVDPLKYIKMD